MNKNFREDNHLDDDTYDEGVDVLGAVPLSSPHYSGVRSVTNATTSSPVTMQPALSRSSGGGSGYYVNSSGGNNSTTGGGSNSTTGGGGNPPTGAPPTVGPMSTNNMGATPGNRINNGALNSIFAQNSNARGIGSAATGLTQPQDSPLYTNKPQLSRMPVMTQAATFVPANALMNAGSSLLSAIKSAVTPNKPGTAAASAASASSTKAVSAATAAAKHATTTAAKLTKAKALPRASAKLKTSAAKVIAKAQKAKSLPTKPQTAVHGDGFTINSVTPGGTGGASYGADAAASGDVALYATQNFTQAVNEITNAAAALEAMAQLGDIAAMVAPLVLAAQTMQPSLAQTGQGILDQIDGFIAQMDPDDDTMNQSIASQAQPILQQAQSWQSQAQAAGVSAGAAGANATIWAPGTSYTVGQQVTNAGMLYSAIEPGVSGDLPGPTGSSPDILDGNVHWAYAGVATAAMGQSAAYNGMSMPWMPNTSYPLSAQVTNQGSLYSATRAGISGTMGPYGSAPNIIDGTVAWQYAGQDPSAYADQGGGGYDGGSGGGSDDGGDGSSDPTDPFSDDYDPSAAGGAPDGGDFGPPGYDPSSMYGQDPFASSGDDDGSSSSDGSDSGWSGDGGSMDDALSSLDDNGSTSDDDASFDADVAAYQANQQSDDVFGLPSVDSFWSTDPAANTSLYYTMNPNAGPAQGTASAGATANLSTSQQNLANIQAQQAQFYQSRNPYANAGQPVQAGTPTGFAAALAASKQNLQSGGQDDVSGLDGGLDTGETTAAMLALGPFAALLFDRGNHLPMLEWAKAYKPGTASYIKPGSSAHRAAVAAEAARAAILASAKQYPQSGGYPMSNSDDSVFGNLPLSIQLEQARAAAAAAVKQGQYVPQSAYQQGQSPYGQQSPYGLPSPYGQSPYGMQDPNAPDPYDAYFADDDSFQGEMPMRSMDRQRARAKQYINSEPIQVFGSSDYDAGYQDAQQMRAQSGNLSVDYAQGYTDGYNSRVFQDKHDILGETEITDEEDDTTRRGASTHAGASYLDPGYPRGGASAGRSGGEVDFNKQTIHVFGDDITIGDDGYEHGMDILGLLGGAKPPAPRAGFVMRKTPGGNSHVSLQVNKPKKGDHTSSIKNARDAANRALSIAKKLQATSKTAIHGLIANTKAGRPVHPHKLLTAAQIQKIASDVTKTANKTLAQAKKHESLISTNRAKTKAGVASVKSKLKKVAAPGTKTKVNGYVDILGLTGFGTPTAESNSLNSQIAAASQASASAAYPAVDPNAGYSTAPADPNNPGYLLDGTMDPNYGAGAGASVDSTGGGTVADPTAGPPYYGLTPPDPASIAPQLNVDYIADPAPSGADNTQYTSVPMGAILYDGTTHDPREAVGSFKAFSEYGGNGTGFFAGNNGWSRRGSPDDDWGGLQAQYSQAANPMLKIAQDSISQGFGPIVGNGRNQSNTAWAKNLRYDMTSGNLFWYYDSAPQDQKQQMLNELQAQAMTDFQAQVAAAAADAASQAAQDQLDAMQAASIAKQQAAEDADQAHQLNLSNAQAAADAQTQGLADTAASQEQQTSDESAIRLQQQMDQSTAAQQAADDASQVAALQAQAQIDRDNAAAQAQIDMQYAQAGIVPPDMQQQQGQYQDDGSGDGSADPFDDSASAGYSGGADSRYNPDLDLDAQSQDSLEGISGSARLKRRKHR